jgi:hypothetical protein
MATKELSVKDKIKKLREETAKLQVTRAGELKREIKELIAELNELTGGSFSLSEQHASAAKKVKVLPKGSKVSEKPKSKKPAKSTSHKKAGARIAGIESDPNGDWAT